MASKADNKFGTFGGVFTPSILTILGVIMYLRLPWVVGNGGLLTTLLIIAAAHVVSICTGLSISSIATDKNVGAGGPYYIVSRSLGLPIGGTLGLALFLGLSFSISLYIIGFSESFLATIDVEPTKNAIRVCGTLTVILLTVITFISTSLAIKTQYLILGLIGLSLASIFLGSPDTVPAEPLIGAPATGEGLPVLFGIFFPAVTGFTAGVNMSGDLRDPKKSIPTGTLAAVGVGLVVYAVLAVFLAYRVPVEELQNNPRVFEDLALWAPAVTAGVWGATLSSALGSILGAPRILQTVSADGITPRVFAAGYGKTHEPRNALLLAFVIGEAGILIAELDVIARVVSMVFMATYGFLNAAAAIEALVSPDFRPEFRIPKTVSVVGAVTCLLLMIQMDFEAMAGATVMMAALFVYLQRRQLRLESGDAWAGVWSTLVRAGLHRLATTETQQRNWRPNILLFRPDDGEARAALLRTAGSLITGNGMLTDVRLKRPGERTDRGGGSGAESALSERGPVVGVFERVVEAEDPLETVSAIAQFHGYAGVEPNTALLDWDGFEAEPAFGVTIDGLRERDLNVLLFSDATHEPPPGAEPRVDVWWRPDSSPSLGISLIRFVGESEEYRDAAIRFLTVTRDSSIADALRNAARRMLVEARVSAEVEIVLDTVEPRSFEHHVEDRSADARLAIVEMPRAPLDEGLEALRAVSRAVPSVLYVAPSSAFEEVGRVVRSTRTHEEELAEPSVDVGALGLPELPECAVDEIGAEVRRFDTQLAGLLTDFHEQSVRRLAARNVEIVQRTTALLDRHLGSLADGLDETHPVKQRRIVNRVQSAFLMDTEKLIDGIVQQDVADQRDILEGRLSALLDDRSMVDPDASLSVERDAADFDATPGESRELARLKAERRRGATGGVVRYDVATGPLLAYYTERCVTEVVDELVRGSAHDAWHLAVTLGKLFNASRTSLTLIGVDASEQSLAGKGADAARAFVEEERERTRERMAEVEAGLLDDATELIETALVRARELARAYGEDLARVDVASLTKSKRKVPRFMAAQREALRDEPGVFYENQRALFDRAKIGLRVSAFQHRLATIVRRSESAIALEVKNGVLHGYVELDRALEALLESETPEPLKAKLEVSHRFDPAGALEALAREGQRSAEELPETTRTLSDASIQRLAEGDADEVEMVDLPLRRLAQFMLDAELIGPLTELLATVPALEERAIGVGEDVVRLIGFHQAEYDEATAEGSFLEHVRPVVENGRERLATEREPLEQIVPTVREVLEEKLAAVLRGTDVFELTSSANKLGTQVRRRQGQRAVSGAQSFLMESAARVRRAVVGAVYGRSAGLLAARRLREGAGGGASVDRILELVDEHHPSSSVLEDLPFYYRQLFFGKSTFNETFWVEREHELAAARRGIAQHERGGRGVIVVTGEPDSGKTALCRRLTGRALKGRETFWVAPPESGIADVSRFARALRDATSQRGDLMQVLASLDDGAVVVIEDLELWWDRSADGLAVIDALMKSFERHSGRLLFLIEIGAHPFDLVNRLRPLADHALSVVDCGPLPAEALKEIVMLRHGSTGMSFEVDGVAEAELGDFSLARLFSNHFNYSRGLVGAALTSWITHIDRVDGGRLIVRAPSRRGWEVLDRLRPEWTALLVQLLLHKRLGRRRLQHVSGLEPRELEQQLDALQRMGMVRASQKGVLSIDRFVRHALIERLRERRVVP